MNGSELSSQSLESASKKKRKLYKLTEEDVVYFTKFIDLFSNTVDDFDAFRPKINYHASHDTLQEIENPGFHDLVQKIDDLEWQICGLINESNSVCATLRSLLKTHDIPDRQKFEVFVQVPSCFDSNIVAALCKLNLREEKNVTKFKEIAPLKIIRKQLKLMKTKMLEIETSRKEKVLSFLDMKDIAGLSLTINLHVKAKTKKK